MSGNDPTFGDDDWLDPPSDDVLAGEFVLGVLDAEQRRLIEARIEREPVFAEGVAAWVRRLGRLAASIEPAAVPPQLWSRVRERLGWSDVPAAGGQYRDA